MSMGTPETATRRLNMAQSFNPMGSLVGMYVAMNFIQARLNPLDTAERAQLSDAEFEAVKQSDLGILVGPYVIIGLVIAVIFLLILFTKMPDRNEGAVKQDIRSTLHRLIHNKRYSEGVVAQFFYVGAQIMCWTFIIQYGTQVFMSEGMDEQTAEVLSQKYNIVAMILFCCSRFICTFFLRFVNAGKLLALLAGVAVLLTLGVIFLQGRTGLYCLVAVSACMSLMFPTIYGIALTGLGDDSKLGAAGLIMSILGGSVLPPLQAMVIDSSDWGFIPAINASFVFPLICFVVVLLYGKKTR